MAKAATTEHGEPRQKRTRSPSAPRPVYVVVQVLDENGHPMNIAKDRVRVLGFEKSAEAVLAKVESGEHPHALYLRGVVPAGR